MPVQKIYNLTDHWYPDKIGGSCIYAYKFHRLLSSKVNIETITLSGEASPQEEQMVVHKTLSKTRFLQNRRILRALDGQSDTIWVVHSPWFFLHLFIAFGFRIRNQVIGVYHGPWFREYYISAAAKKNALAKVLFTLPRYVVELFYALYVNRFIFLSEKMYRATSEYLPISPSKVQIIPMWSEQVAWDPPRAKNDQLVLSTFRRLEPRMGLQDFLSALTRCDLENYSLYVCGDGPYRDELARQIERLNLQDHVKLLGWVTQEQKFQLIKNSDAVIIPSRTLEGFSLLALESLEHGTPVLLTDAVGFYEYVQDVEQDFVKRIDLAGSNVEMRDFLTKGRARDGLNRIESAFSAEEVRRSLLKVLIPEARQATEPFHRSVRHAARNQGPPAIGRISMSRRILGGLPWTRGPRPERPSQI